mgnify:CR=1 FL=1
MTTRVTYFATTDQRSMPLRHQAVTTWLEAKKAAHAPVTADRLQRLAHMPSHWPDDRPAQKLKSPGNCLPRHPAPTLADTLARVAPSVTRAVAQHRLREAAQ